MTSFEIIGYTKDLRTNTNVLYAKINIDDYLDLVGTNYNKFNLQRKREIHKGYDRLMSDLRKGALIPTMTLAIEPSIAKSFVHLAEEKNNEEIKKRILEIKDNIYILDGLQRTHKIKELISDNVTFSPDQKLLLEIWIEPEINHLLYRLIVLNSGQKPMSMRHQIELLFTTMRVTLNRQIPDLEILVENEEEKRTKAKQIPFERLVTAYKSFLIGSPEVDKDLLISEKIVEEKILENNEAYLTATFVDFRNYLIKYCDLDFELFRICKTDNTLNSFRNWFADSNVINSFFAAIGMLNEDRAKRVNTAIDKLLADLKSAKVGEDILNLNDYKMIKEEVADPKLFNVGYATRKLLTDSFNEYFRDEGHTSLQKCWLREARNIKNSKNPK